MKFEFQFSVSTFFCDMLLKSQRMDQHSSDEVETG